MPPAFFAILREAVEGVPGRASLPVDALRDAGFAAGEALYESFSSWLAEQGEAAPGELADDRFPPLLEAFLHQQGWGRLEMAQISDAVMACDAFDWAEAGTARGGCLVSTGLLAGLLGRIAGAPLAVLEVDIGVTPGHCRFLVGSVEIMHHVWEAMARGVPYERAAERL
jgi:hypothetical protein